MKRSGIAVLAFMTLGLHCCLAIAGDNKQNNNKSIENDIAYNKKVSLESSKQIDISKDDLYKIINSNDEKCIKRMAALERILSISNQSDTEKLDVIQKELRDKMVYSIPISCEMSLSLNIAENIPFVIIKNMDTASKIKRLLEMRNDKNRSISVAMPFVLKNIDNEPVNMTLLVELYDNGDYRTKYQIMRGLAIVKSKNANIFIEKGIQDKNTQVKMAAIQSLGLIDEKSAMQKYKIIANNEKDDINVRNQAMNAMNSINDGHINSDKYFFELHKEY